MDVLINVDRAYLKGLVVTVESLLLHARKPCRLHLAVDGFECRLIEELRRQWHGHPQLESLEIGDLAHVPADYRGNCHFSRAAYGKVWLPPRYNNHNGNLLLLDPDTIVLRDVCELSQLDLGASVLAAAASAGSRRFNSGVLLANLPEWRAQEVQQRMLDSWHEDPHVINAEQDLLHRVIPISEVHWLEGAWNVVPNEWQRHQPAIVHCIGGRKPWHGDYDREHGIQQIFYSYLDRTFLQGRREWGLPGVCSFKRRWNKWRIALNRAA